MVDQHYLTGDIDWKLIHMALIAETLSQYDNMMGLEMQRLRSAMEVREIEFSRYADKTESYILSELSKTNNDNVVHILKNGGGKLGLCRLFEQINGTSQSNEIMADFIFEQASKLSFMNIGKSDKS